MSPSATSVISDILFKATWLTPTQPAASATHLREAEAKSLLSVLVQNHEATLTHMI